jgi:hypothetical protein
MNDDSREQTSRSSDSGWTTLLGAALIAAALLIGDDRNQYRFEIRDRVLWRFDNYSGEAHACTFRQPRRCVSITVSGGAMRWEYTAGQYSSPTDTPSEENLVVENDMNAMDPALLSDTPN